MKRRDIKMPDELWNAIKAKNKSAWIREAIKMCLEKEAGLTPKYVEELAIMNAQIIAIGRNINQIARAANSGKSVSVDNALLKETGKKLREAQKEINAVRSKLD